MRIRLTKTDYLAALAAAAITAVLHYTAPKTDGILLFGDDDAQPAKAKRMKLGHIERWTGADGREYTLRLTDVGVGDAD